MNETVKEENELLIKLFKAKGEDFIVENGVPLLYGRSGWNDYDYCNVILDERYIYLKIAADWKSRGLL